MIIFSDLGGTLLDPNGGYRPAEPALQMLGARDIPLVFVTSRTASEVAPLMADLGLATPAIVEGGCGVFDGAAQGDEDRHYTEIRAALDALPAPLRTRFEGYGDMTAERIADVTGLTPDIARAARRRRFSEIGLFDGFDEERTAFSAALRSAGLVTEFGERFVTISRGRPLATRMTQIRDLMQGRLQRRLFPIIALGDQERDRPMLEAADIAVVVSNPAHPPVLPLIGEESGRVIRTELPGPEGWNAVVQTLVGLFARYQAMREAS